MLSSPPIYTAYTFTAYTAKRHDNHRGTSDPARSRTPEQLRIQKTPARLSPGG
ncbi:MAG: hypothetical protein LW822_08600 [Phycisphaeraceae bacterium]|nr:hypothetical protein [Phycisphaeraceae bacterium]